MTYIDFHVHAFTDAIAERAISRLEATANMTSLTRGTLEETIRLEQQWGVSCFVLLPVATKPKQMHVINNWAAEVIKSFPQVTSFGSLHPDAPDALEELYRIRELGLAGVKLHPDYQDFDIDDERMFPIYECCAKLQLPITFHAGRDPLCPDRPRATPQTALRVLRTFPSLTVILAHLGGCGLWEDVEQYLAGASRSLYLDTSFLHGHFPAPCPDELLYRIIRKHGADRILLASDCPWDSIPETVAQLERLGLTEEEKELIFYRNALELLKGHEL